MLSKEQKEFYKENGYIVVNKIFSESELSECSAAYDELFTSKQANHSNLEAQWAGSWKNESKQSVLSIHNLQCHNSVFTKMLLNDTLLDVISELMGSSNILLHHTKAHLKPPTIGAKFPTHQDYHYFPFKNDTMMAIIIHLEDTGVENGGLAVFPGSHNLGPLENKSNVPTHFYVDQDKFPLAQGKAIRARRGDVLIFSYLLVHGSYANTSNENRRILLFQVMSADDEPLKQVHLSPCHGMVLRGSNMHNADSHPRYES